MANLPIPLCTILYTQRTSRRNPIGANGKRMVKIKIGEHPAEPDKPKPSSKKAKKRERRRLQLQKQCRIHNPDKKHEVYIASPATYRMLYNDSNFRMLCQYRAIRIDDMGILRRLITDFPPEEWLGFHLMRAAARRNNLPAVKILLEAGCPVNLPEHFHPGHPLPIHFAKHNRNNKMVKLLVSKGADASTEVPGGKRRFKIDCDYFFIRLEDYYGNRHSDGTNWYWAFGSKDNSNFREYLDNDYDLGRTDL